MRLNRFFLDACLAQCGQVGDADFRDVLLMLVGGGAL